jgi:hypothetical protein
VTANRPTTGITILVQRFLTFLTPPSASRVPLLEF